VRIFEAYPGCSIRKHGSSQDEGDFAVEHWESQSERIRLSAYEVMARQGYLDRVEKVGRELERWRRYLDAIGRPGRPQSLDPMAQPRIFPMMKGLHTSPWQEAEQLAATSILEESFPTIRREIEALDASKFMRYDGSALASGRWTVMPVFVFGEEAQTLLQQQNPFPETARIIKSLPDVCQTLPLADVVFSAHAPRTSLVPHCSWDPFRLRLHLGIHVPRECGIRVGQESRAWHEGKVLAFHDSFEHETWNHSDATRTVLIVDQWHPGLTLIERRAILACFRKKEIRGALMRTRAPAAMQPALYSRFVEMEQRDSLVAEFWKV
jgi:Aspartyl/Asparaginyl beta-hydroxylase